MSDKKGTQPHPPSAPPPGVHPEFVHHRGPPPSYEESQKNDYRPPPNYYSSVNQTRMPNYSTHTGYPVNNIPYNQGFQQMPPNYNTPQAGVIYPNAMTSQNAGLSSTHTVEYDAGARFKGKGGGSITVPPPPPGYLPNPAQLAALQGQPVVLKKKRNSFF